MTSIVTPCPKCSEPNEVHIRNLPRRLTSVSCWHCATRVELDEREVERVRDAPPVPDAGAERLLIETGKENAGESRRRALILALAIGLPVSVLVIFWIAAALSADDEVAGGGGQFRARYHQGAEVPEGIEAWKTKIQVGSAYAPARRGDLLIVASNESKVVAAVDFAPLGVPEDVLPRLRELHEKMLLLGFRMEGETYKTALASGQDEIVRLRLEKGTCYTVAAFGSGKSRNVDMLLYEPYGSRPVISDARTDLDALIEYCAETQGEHRFEVRMRQGGGLVSFVVYRRAHNTLHEKGHVYALDRETGEVQWDSVLEDQVSSSPAATENVVVLGTRTLTRSKAIQTVFAGGALRVLDAQDGSSQCFFEADGPVLSSPVLEDGIAFFGSCGQVPAGSVGIKTCQPGSPVPSRFYAVKTSDCNQVWSVATPHPVLTDPAIDGARVYFSTGSTLVAIDSTTGVEVWRHQAQGLLGSPVTARGIVVVGSEDRTVRAHNAADGEILWIFSSDAAMLATPVIADDFVYSGSEDSTLFAIDAATGQRVWDAGLAGPINSPIGVAAGLVLVTANDQVTAVHASSGSTVFQFAVEGGLAPTCAPILVHGMVYFTDRAGTVYALR